VDQSRRQHAEERNRPERARRGECLCSAHPLDDARRGELRDHDEGRVAENDDPDRTGSDACMRFHKRRQDVREQRVADDDEDDVHGNDDQEPAIAGDGPESSSHASVRRRGA
jgi:hypothetical protein